MPDEPRTALVTGAARGIGAAIVTQLVADGLRVVALDRDWPTGSPEFRADPAVTRCRVDVSDLSALQEVVAGLERLDVLVNNAGISRRAALEDLDETTWDAVHTINLRAPVALTREVLPLLGRGACVVNVSSLRATRGFAGDAAYIAAKGGLDAVTRALAVELGPRGVRVNAVAPGAIETELNAEILADPDHRQRVMSRIPLGRLGLAAEVAAATSFLASPAAAFVTGAVLAVDGGQGALG